MALATRPKPTVSHKKRQAGHHRHSKHYLKPYWPYLPIAAIVAAGAIVNAMWSAGILPGVSQASTTAAAGGQVTRIQAVAGAQAGQVLAVVIIVSGAAAALFAYRHGRLLHRYLVKGEAFVYEHSWLDITAVLVCTVGFILTRNGGGPPLP